MSIREVEFENLLEYTTYKDKYIKNNNKVRECGLKINHDNKVILRVLEGLY